ncbi:MAG: DNA polymerase IV [Bacteroidetes bacterium]|nr:MAG: DNA polymerase IV [Bacteroidota bacterium]
MFDSRKYRSIAHFDLDSFFVSVERLINSNLIGLPVLIGGSSGRGVVASCSYEARKFGIHSAMPIKLARRLCKEAIVVRGNMELYSKYSRLVSDIIADSAPIYEKASIDEHYLDISGMDRFFGSFKWAQKLRQRIIKESGLPISFGLSINKTVAKIATGESKPNGELYIPFNRVESFLSPLSIRKIPMIGEQTFQRLYSKGISDIKSLRSSSPEMIEHILGKNGLIIWKKANGIDNRPVRSYYEQKSISSERTFEEDSSDVKKMHNIIIGMVGHLMFQLRKQQKLSGVISIKIRYSNFETYNMQQSIPYTSLDHIVIKTATELFDKLYQHGRLIRLIGVRIGQLIQGKQQLNLFDDIPEHIELYQAMDTIRLRFGKNSISRAVSIKTSEERTIIEKKKKRTK